MCLSFLDQSLANTILIVTNYIIINNIDLNSEEGIELLGNGKCKEY